MTTFVVMKDIYNYHDYNAYGLVAKTISHVFVHSCKWHSHKIFDYYSHNGIHLLQLYIYNIIFTSILLYYKITNDVMKF